MSSIRKSFCIEGKKLYLNTSQCFQLSLSSAQIERNKSKEQIEEEKRISLTFRVKPLQIHGLSIPKLQSKARELWDTLVKLETEKYDLEERQKRQDYDVRICRIRDFPFSKLKLDDFRSLEN